MLSTTAARIIQPNLSLITVNDFGELSAGTSIDLAVANANGVAIMSPPDVMEQD